AISRADHDTSKAGEPGIPAAGQPTCGLSQVSYCCSSNRSGSVRRSLSILMGILTLQEAERLTNSD
ncbi:hypothetical protein, partial [Leptolyngbya sp. FACHB-261]|uniref:hypothetical protein n=1 Tax=Leptolyngbya sp. FACHB-261 TaxID=2692806 RepID=UPI001A7EA914